MGDCLGKKPRQKKGNKRSHRVIDFIEQLIVPSGVGAGSPFRLEDFQKNFIHDIYGSADANNILNVTKAVLSIARKNGKTMICASLILAHLVGPEAVMNGEIYSVATEIEQAAIVFNYTAQIVRADPELEALLKVIDSKKTIVCYQNGSNYKALSAKYNSKYGYNPTLVVYDELSQAPNDDLYIALDTASGAREESLFITISTQSANPQHILSRLIDDGLDGRDPTTVVHLFAVPNDAVDIFTNKKLWKLANPALGSFRSMKEIATYAKKARRMPSFESAFRNLYLNQRVDAKSPVIPRQEWEACAGTEQLIDGEDIYLALDLSATTDLTALVAVSAKPGGKIRTKAWFWKPEETLREHERRDRVPFQLWKKLGFIQTCPGRSVDYAFVAQQLRQIKDQYNIVSIAYDRWRIDSLIKEMSAIGLETETAKDKIVVSSGVLRLTEWGQGFKDISPAVEALENVIMSRTLIHNNNPVLTWNISNAIAVIDPAGERKFDKSKSRFRIDGAVALAMAVGLRARDMKPIKKPSIYETRNLA